MDALLGQLEPGKRNGKNCEVLLVLGSYAGTKPQIPSSSRKGLNVIISILQVGKQL